MARLSTTRITRWRPCLREALDSGAPPYLARLPMTPEEVAASYHDAEDDPGSDHDMDIGVHDLDPDDEW